MNDSSSTRARHTIPTMTARKHNARHERCNSWKCKRSCEQYVAITITWRTSPSTSMQERLTRLYKDSNAFAPDEISESRRRRMSRAFDTCLWLSKSIHVGQIVCGASAECGCSDVTRKTRRQTTNSPCDVPRAQHKEPGRSFCLIHTWRQCRRPARCRYKGARDAAALRLSHHPHTLQPRLSISV